MSEPALKPELLRSLGRLIRGLSALFWGLPITLVVCVKSGFSEWLKGFGAMPPVLAMLLLYYGLTQLGHFQKQERAWLKALERAKIFALVNVGLAPFLYFWNRLPNVPFFSQSIAVLMLTSLLFLFTLNQVLQRLTAMLPDETLRAETKLFTNLNLYLFMSTVGLFALYFTLLQMNSLPHALLQLNEFLEKSRQFLLLVLILFPVAMTMTLIWKIKELVLSSVFEAES
ncbi:MAG: hypothetical protein HY043_17980 [Verrucomicrobia bacterium]|nr:hypothetical protein [Verrucomicrobiota bacterium]